MNGVFDPRHIGIHAERLPEGIKRQPPFSLPLINHAAAGQCAKVARLQIKNLFNIGAPEYADPNV